MATSTPRDRDRRGLVVLDTEECYARIRATPVGRVGFVQDDEVLILPVNHVVVDAHIAFYTSWGSKLQVAADTGPMTFEVDGHDASQARGWSVLVVGSAEIVHDPTHREELDALAPPTWAPRAENMFWVLISPGRVSGREIPAAVAETGDDTRDLRP